MPSPFYLQQQIINQLNIKIMSRIQLSDNTMDVIVKMSEGNPGAMTALMEMLDKGAKIDPDDFMGGLGAVLDLDTNEIYGTNIYVFYSDICDRNIAKMLSVLRACQLGFFNRQTLIDACNRQDRSGKKMIPVEELYLQVKERLPNFHSTQGEA